MQLEAVMQDVETIFRRYEAVHLRLPKAVTAGPSREIASLLDLVGEVDAFVFDAFGVLNVGETLIEGADTRLNELRAKGFQIRILTNAASYDRQRSVQKFLRLGLRVHEHEIITSRDAAIQNLQDFYWGVIAAPDDELTDIPFRWARVNDDPASYAEVDGFLFLSSSNWTEARQSLLETAMNAEPRPLVVANPDLVAPRDDGFSIEPGFFGHRIADRHPDHVSFYGKPFPDAYRLVEETLPGIDTSRIVMCGDTLHTDIIGAAARGWQTVLVTRDGLFAGFDAQDFAMRSGILANWRVARI